MTKNSDVSLSRRAGRRAAMTLAALAALAATAGVVRAASGPERALAGVSIFAAGSEVTRKFGNPSRILVGGTAPAPFNPSAGAAGGAAGGPGGAPGGGSPGQLPGFPSGPPGGQGGEFPGGGGGFPGGGGGFPGGAGFAGGAAPQSTAPVKSPVTLIYDRANGGSLEFTISPDKRVVQIRETGYNGAYGTSRGIRLGMKYNEVVARYGYPENTYIQGSIISTDYKDTLHCGFQFLDQRLVAIIVASPN